MGKLVPILLAVVGLGGGIGAGLALRPSPVDAAMDIPPEKDAAEEKTATSDSDHSDEEETAPYDYVKMNNQFIVTVVEDGRVDALVVVSLTLEVEPGESSAVYEREPKLQDAFLQVMFDHANAGGFRGEFTDSGQLKVLRAAMRETGQRIAGPAIHDVLILNIVRQDV